LEKLTVIKLKSFIVNTNDYLNKILSSFNSFYKKLSLSFQLVDNFSDYFSFYIVNSKDKDITDTYLCKHDKVLEDSLVVYKIVIIISNTSIKDNVAMTISYVCLDYNILAKTIYYTVNVTSTKMELFAIRCGINQVIQLINVICIIVITDAIHLAR